MFSNSTRERLQKQAQNQSFESAETIASRNGMKISHNKEAGVYACKEPDSGIYVAADSISQLIDKMWSANIR